MVRTIPVNSQTYNEEIQFSGDPVEFVSSENTGNGGWFAWQMGSGDASWRAVGGDYRIIKKLDGDIPDRPGTSPPANAYPNVLINIKEDEFIRSNPFKNSLYPNITSTAYMDNTKSVVDQLIPQNLTSMNKHVIIRYDKDVKANNIDKGRTDLSTELKEYLPYALNSINDVKVSLDRATITYTQEHDNAKYYRKLSAGNAAMLFYYAAFEYVFKTYSYRYPDQYVVYIKGTRTNPNPWKLLSRMH